MLNKVKTFIINCIVSLRDDKIKIGNKKGNKKNMNLVEIYEDYKKINKEYSIFIENISNGDVKTFYESTVESKLKSYNEKIQELKGSIDALNSDDEDNSNDLNYLVVDLMFLSIDLLNFYTYKEVERFKMRVANYLNKQRRSEMFN